MEPLDEIMPFILKLEEAFMQFVRIGGSVSRK
ncbi:hypothetical protein PALA111701_22275 [Paenibacillus lactis]